MRSLVRGDRVVARSRRFSPVGLFGWDQAAVTAAVRAAAQGLARFGEMRADEPRCDVDGISGDGIEVDGLPQDDLPLLACFGRAGAGCELVLVNNRTFMTAIELPADAGEPRLEGGDQVSRAIAWALVRGGDPVIPAGGTLRVRIPESARSPLLVTSRPRADLLLYALMSRALLGADRRVEDIARFVRCTYGLVEEGLRDDPEALLRFARAQFNACVKEFFPTMARGFLRVLLAAVDTALPSVEAIASTTNPQAVRGSVRVNLPTLTVPSYRRAVRGWCEQVEREASDITERFESGDDLDWNARLAVTRARLLELADVIDHVSTRLRPLRPPATLRDTHALLRRALAALTRGVREGARRLDRGEIDQSNALELLGTLFQPLADELESASPEAREAPELQGVCDGVGLDS